MKKQALGLAALITVTAVANAAAANCAMPVGYGVKVEGNTVTVCPQDFGQRTCPDADGMLRETPGGSTVKLADYCDGSCYVDECVPKGEHRYGFAKPFDCCSSCCGTDYFGTAEVTTDLPASCQLSANNPGAEPYTGPIPWGDDPTLCSYQGGGGGPQDSGTNPVDGGAGTANANGASGSSDGGCAIGSPGTASKVVFGFNGLLLALGLVLRARRRAKKES